MRIALIDGKYPARGLQASHLIIICTLPTLFLYEGNLSNVSIMLMTQKNYDDFLLSQCSIWIAIFLSVPIIYVMDRRIHR